MGVARLELPTWPSVPTAGHGPLRAAPAGCPSHSKLLCLNPIMLLTEHLSDRWGLWVLGQPQCLHPTPIPCSMSSWWDWPRARPSPTPGLVKAGSGSPSKVTFGLLVTTLTPGARAEPTMLFLKSNPSQLPALRGHSPLPLRESLGLSTSCVWASVKPPLPRSGREVSDPERVQGGGQDESSPALWGGSLHPHWLTGWGSWGGCTWAQRVSRGLWLGRGGQTAVLLVTPEARAGKATAQAWARPNAAPPSPLKPPLEPMTKGSQGPTVQHEAPGGPAVRVCGRSVPRRAAPLLGATPVP